MAVTYAQFIVEFPEFSEIDQTMVDPVLTMWDTFLSGFGSTLHDRAVYRRTALELSRSVFGLPMTQNDLGGEQTDKYLQAWEDIVQMSYRRMTITGGGLT